MKLVLATAAAVLVLGCLGPRMDGPIQPGAEITVGLPLASIAVTWAMPLGPISAPYVLRRVELVDVSGFEVVAVMACEGASKVGEDYNSCGPVGAPWPPVGVTLRDVEGTRIGVGPEEAASILVAVRLQPGSSAGRIERMRVYYTYGGVDYVVEQPWALQMPST